MFALKFRSVESEACREFLDKSRFIGQRFAQLNQLLSTIVLLYRQVIASKVKEAFAESLETFAETGSRMGTAFESLKSKRNTLNHSQEVYCKTGDALERETVLAATEPSKDRMKTLKQAKATAEEAYRSEYVA